MHPSNSTQQEIISENKTSSKSRAIDAQWEAAGASEFFWTYTEEPHQTRRQAIIKSHPEVLQLVGHEPSTKYIIFGVVVLQLITAYLVQNWSITSLKFLITSYVIGATSNHNLFVAIHELSHNLAFKKPIINRYYSIFTNLPIGIPYSAAFRPYHLTHHKSLGIDGLDVDLPTKIEAMLLDSVLGKAFFCSAQIIFYSIRPLFIYQIPINSLHMVNFTIQMIFNGIILAFFGINSMCYFLLSSMLAGSLHPCAGHFIAEHYVMNHPTQDEKQSDLAQIPIPETYSYYGPLNAITYNVGYHNEHHDFPAIPGSRLPRLREIAKEYYDPLPHHESWPWAIWQFITDKQYGIWCRVKRSQHGRIMPNRMRIDSEGNLLITESEKKNLLGWKHEDLGLNEKSGVQISGVL